MSRLRKDTNWSAEITKSTGMIAAALLLLIALSSPAYAVRCNEWLGLAPNDRDLKVKELIHELLNSPKAAGWTSINKSKIERCLVQQTPEIEIDFNDACSQGSQAPVDVLDEILLKHARSCAQTAR
jgi:hypothetical protein